MQIDYYYSSEPLGSLDVPDIGNCFVKGNTDEGVEFYFGTRTQRGFTRQIIYGPIYQEDTYNMLPKVNFEVKYQEFNPTKLKKDLTSMLNRIDKYRITQAQIITEDEFRNNFKNPMVIFYQE